MFFNCREEIMQITNAWKGERFEDGRPKVPSHILERVSRITVEEAWKTLWTKGYKYQFESDFKLTHDPNAKLVGRAVTGVMVPKRPDLHDSMLGYGNQMGYEGFFNQWMIDNLVEDDVVVVDMYDKIYEGTYVGGNLSTAIAARTKRGGSVIWGGVRDLEQIVNIKGIQTFYRGTDPTGISECTMTGMNTATRIGKAICLPGDVVLGTRSGVIFIPPQFAEEVAEQAEKLQIMDIFGFIRLEEKVYTTAQIDRPWTIDMMSDFVDWFQKDECAVPYRHLTWDEELENALKQLDCAQEQLLR